ncbi:MAG TPA: nucleoside triphosphate pyrophosphohydrolase [Candidatus Limnocylindrales bacterium]
MLDAFVAEARIRWGLDPTAGLQIATADRLAETPIEPARPLLLVPLTALRVTGPATPVESSLPGRHAPADRSALAILRRLYPADHIVGRVGMAEATTVDELDAAALAGPLYLAPLAPERATASPWALPWIADRLRRPDGCPWDREQTHQSLKKHLLEEAYEVYDILDRGATPELAGELGDLYLQIVLHAQLAAEAGVFDMTDVEEAISRKIVRRHPHVFGDARVSTTGDVNRQWEQIKRGEREDAAAAGAPGEATEVRSALDGISRSMPALAATQEMQERAANLGYDWPEIVGILDKVHEELAELAAATTDEEKREEVGDLLLVVTNLARRHGVEAEGALRAAGEKFRDRFRRVERMSRERGVQLRDMSFAELDELWDAAKAEARAEAGGHLTAANKESAE